MRADLLVDVSLRQAFQQRSLDALDDINGLLLSISRHCWSELAERSGSEHYVWDSIEAWKQTEGIPVLRCRVDDALFEHGLYLTPGAKQLLEELRAQLDGLVSMEVALAERDPHPLIVDSAVSGYELGLRSVSSCQAGLLAEFGLARSSKTTPALEGREPV